MKKVLVASVATALMVFSVMGWAHSSDNAEHNAYWHDSTGQYLKDSAGRCIKTSSWFAGTEIEGCDEIIKPVMAAAIDSDDDGVVNSSDTCPHTPAGVLVDRNGCALDSDKDSVANYKDKCLRTPAGAEVDTNGCEIKTQVLMEVNLNVRFAVNSATITDAYRGDIKRVADFMKKAPGSLAYIEGHTDSTGGEAYNQDLSLRRAQAVADLLVNNFGIAKSRVKLEHYGESRPVADNGTKEGRHENRRVVAVVKGLVKKN